MQVHTQTISVEVPNNHDRPSRRFAPGRVCGDYNCGTHLSIYNNGYYCSLHAPSAVPRVWVKNIA